MMNGRETLKPKPSTSLWTSGVLQRKCACGQHTVAGGECSECEKKNDVLPHSALDQSTQSRFNQDFSTVPTHTGANTPARESGGPLEQDGDPMREPTTPLFPRAGSSTLPYRESTEFAKCLQIMGEKNRDYCLEAVPREIARPSYTGTGRRDPLNDMSTFQSPGFSGWFGAKFGCYRDGCKRKHRGWDIHAPVGTPIFATVTGTVSRHTESGGLGDFIRLTSSTDPTRAYLYAHLSDREPAGFYTAGSMIGKTGATGNASPTRPHLHLQLQVSGTNIDPGSDFVEPTQVIEATGSSASTIDKSLAEPCTPCAM